MTRPWFLILLLLAATPARGGPTLTEELQAVVDAARARGGKFTIVVEDVSSGKRLYAINPTVALKPASNVKLLTTSAALHHLGPHFVLETRLRAGGAQQGGTLQGDLWVVGGGDPTISRRFDKEPLLDELAAAVVAAKLKRVAGDLIVDDRAFDAVRLHKAWEPSDGEHWYGAEISALSLNDNCVDVQVAGGARLPRVVLKPSTGYLKLDLRARLVAARKRHRWSAKRAGTDKRTLRVTGGVWRKARPGYTKSIPVPDPARYFGTVLRERLEARGVEVEGALRRPRSDERPRGKALWTRSTKLVRVVRVINQNSQNLYAECLLKTLGRWLPNKTLGGVGTWPKGLRLVRGYARLTCGLPTAEVLVVDGSGLSHTNRLSANALVTILKKALRAKTGRVFRESLARPGKNGTLRRRFRKLPQGVALRAKTGTLTGVAALSGILEKGQRRWVFSLIMNGKPASHRVLNRLVRVLVRHL